MISKHSTVAASEAQVSTAASGEVTILNLKNGTYYGFVDEVGVTVWECLQQPRRVDTLVDRIMEEYDVTRDQCERDVMALLQDLLNEGLITLAK